MSLHPSYRSRLHASYLGTISGTILTPRSCSPKRRRYATLRHSGQGPVSSCPIWKTHALRSVVRPKLCASRRNQRSIGLVRERCSFAAHRMASRAHVLRLLRAAHNAGGAESDARPRCSRNPFLVDWMMSQDREASRNGLCLYKARHHCYRVPESSCRLASIPGKFVLGSSN